MSRRLGDLATIARSKNAGPFRLTLDVFFEDEATYRTVVESGAVTPEAVAAAYGVPESDVIGVYELDRLQAIKVSMQRPIPSGDVRDTDVYGAQQHGPLLDLVVEP